MPKDVYGLIRDLHNRKSSERPNIATIKDRLRLLIDAANKSQFKVLYDNYDTRTKLLGPHEKWREPYNDHPIRPLQTRVRADIFMSFNVGL